MFGFFIEGFLFLFFLPIFSDEMSLALSYVANSQNVFLWISKEKKKSPVGSIS